MARRRSSRSSRPSRKGSRRRGKPIGKYWTSRGGIRL